MQRAFEVTVLGTSSASPTKYRYPSAQFVRMEGEYILLDCGEGAQLQMVRLGLRMHRLKYIFITHMHGDHFFGLPGLITSMGLFGRKEKLTIAGPKDLEFVLKTILASGNTKLPFEIEFIVCNGEKPQVVVENSFFQVTSIPLKHRIPCTGFILKEVGPELKLNAKRCQTLKIPVEAFEGIKKGNDFEREDGSTIANSELTFPGKKNRSYAYITDTIYDVTIAEEIKGVELLYHESTFLHELLDRATETHHSTALQAGNIARMAGVSKLLLGHFSARYNSTDELLAEAQTAFKNAEIAIEGVSYTV